MSLCRRAERCRPSKRHPGCVPRPFSTAAKSIKGPCCTPGLKTVADLEFGDGGDELFGEGIVDARLDVQPVRANAGLSGVAILGNDRSLDGGIEIGVVEDDEGRVAAEFQRKLL